MQEIASFKNITELKDNIGKIDELYAELETKGLSPNDLNELVPSLRYLKSITNMDSKGQKAYIRLWKEFKDEVQNLEVALSGAF